MEGPFQFASLLRHPTISTALSLPNHSNSNSNSHSAAFPSYSKPILLLDLIWNLAFVLVSVVVLFSSFRERPSTPLRLWASVYALQCLLHVAFLSLHHFTRARILNHPYAAVSDDDDDHMAPQSIVKRLESINTLISSIWWVIGFYWIVSGGQALLQDSPRLYWLTVVFLAFDVFFIIFCIGMALVAFLAVFCCLPMLAIAYVVAIRKGASEDDIQSLPKYRYYQDTLSKTLSNDKKQEGNSTTALPLLPEDSDCCICLSKYVDGVELYSLPCSHHFHCRCISKWLRINATCPLCKFDIRSGDTLV